MKSIEDEIKVIIECLFFHISIVHRADMDDEKRVAATRVSVHNVRRSALSFIYMDCHILTDTTEGKPGE